MGFPLCPPQYLWYKEVASNVLCTHAAEVWYGDCVFSNMVWQQCVLPIWYGDGAWRLCVSVKCEDLCVM